MGLPREGWRRGTRAERRKQIASGRRRMTTSSYYCLSGPPTTAAVKEDVAISGHGSEFPHQDSRPRLFRVREVGRRGSFVTMCSWTVRRRAQRSFLTFCWTLFFRCGWSVQNCRQLNFFRSLPSFFFFSSCEWVSAVVECFDC